MDYGDELEERFVVLTLNSRRIILCQYEQTDERRGQEDGHRRQ
jgi:hypothetical protein